MLNRTTASLLLIIATILWGFAFVAQKSAMAHLGPNAYIGARYLLGGLAILPLAIWEYRRRAITLSRADWLLIVGVAVNFFLGSILQQIGLQFTTATNGGFLTGLYVFFVPIFLLAVFRTKPHPIIWAAAPLAFVGIYLLNGASFDRINNGDLLIILCSAFWGMHVLLLGYTATKLNLPVFVSSMSFLMAGAMAGAIGLPLEQPDFAQIQGAWVEIAYGGLCATAIAFTLQAVAQTKIPPANAAIILSGEALFAALGGAIFLGERLPVIGYFGALCIISAMLLVEVLPTLRKQKPGPAI